MLFKNNFNKQTPELTPTVSTLTPLQRQAKVEAYEICRCLGAYL